MHSFFEKDWFFLNAGSPSDLFPTYFEDGSVLTREYSGFQSGHFLVSRSFVSCDKFRFEVNVFSFDEGIRIGVYRGRGENANYLAAEITKNEIKIVMPSGITTGDTFRSKGTSPYFVLYRKSFNFITPSIVSFSIQNGELQLAINGVEVIRTHLSVEVIQNDYGRILIGSLAIDHPAKPREAVFSECCFFGQIKSERYSGYLKDKNGNPLSNYAVHVAGFPDIWEKTDQWGHFALEGIPEGRIELIAGKERHKFFRFSASCKNEEITIFHEIKSVDAEKKLYEEITYEAERINLNGLWTFDKTKVIKVPFSYYSLAAFGEEFLADDNNNMQADPWSICPKNYVEEHEYQRTVSIPEGAWELVIGACSGFSKVYLDEQIVGTTMDSYESFHIHLGAFTKEEKHVLRIINTFDLRDKASCTGKQSFWFHAAPGIWQSVYLEKEEEIRVRDILVYDSENSNIQKKAIVNWDLHVSNEESLKIDEHGGVTINKAYSSGIYRLRLLYESAVCQKVQIHVNEETAERELPATGRVGYFDKADFYIKLNENVDINIQVKAENEQAFQCHEIRFANCLSPVSVNAKLIENQDCHAEGEKNNQTALNELYRATCNTEINQAGQLISSFVFDAGNLREWTPEYPKLYQLSVEAEIPKADSQEKSSADQYTCGIRTKCFVRNWGFRTISTRRSNDERSTAEILVNGKATYIRGVLDQGYNPWGIYTYPSDGVDRGSALFDIKAAKRFGYNLIRMHVKDTEPNWYSMCDREGILVWDEHPTNFYGTSEDPVWRSMYDRRLKDMIRKHNYHPSVVLFSCFNESWGMSGDHEMSMWDNAAAQSWQRETSAYTKIHENNVLVIDNSGYAKSSLTDVLDYHVYPDEFTDANDVFMALGKENFDGSMFNCYNEGNRTAVLNNKSYRILQRTSQLNLSKQNYIGNDIQKGQPVIISEFVHTNRFDQMVRRYPFAGYIRMNLASYETEDTSVLTATRRERDFGWRHLDGTFAGYSYINSDNLIYPSFPYYSKVYPRQILDIPIYLDLDSGMHSNNYSIALYEIKTTIDGEETSPERISCTALPKKNAIVNRTEKQLTVRYIVPEKTKAVHLYLCVETSEGCIAENDLRMEVVSTQENRNVFCSGNPVDVETKYIHGKAGEGDKSGFYVHGYGKVTWRVVQLERLAMTGESYLDLELSTCEYLNGTQISMKDDQYESCNVIINGRNTECRIRTQGWDEQAVFSNCAASPKEEQKIAYKCFGTYGYGSKVRIRLTTQDKEIINKKGYLEFTVVAGNTGIMLYGNRLGRYGTEPIIVTEDK